MDGAPFAMDVANCTLVSVNGCTMLETREKRVMKAAVRWQGDSKSNILAHNTLGKGADGHTVIDKSSGVMLEKNLQSD